MKCIIRPLCFFPGTTEIFPIIILIFIILILFVAAIVIFVIAIIGHKYWNKRKGSYDANDGTEMPESKFTELKNEQTQGQTPSTVLDTMD